MSSLAVTAAGLASSQLLTVSVTCTDGRTQSFQAHVRIDTPVEGTYERHGGPTAASIGMVNSLTLPVATFGAVILLIVCSCNPWQSDGLARQVWTT